DNETAAHTNVVSRDRESLSTTETSRLTKSTECRPIRYTHRQSARAYVLVDHLIRRMRRRTRIACRSRRHRADLHFARIVHWRHLGVQLAHLDHLSWAN